MTEQKKLMVLGALFVAMLAIGAFQFIPKGAPPAPPVTTDEESTVADGTDGEGAEGDGEVVEGEGDGEVDTTKLVVNALGEAVEPLNARDPFQEKGSLKPLDAEPVEEPKPPVQNTTPAVQNNRPPALPSGGQGYEPVNPGGFPGFPDGLPSDGGAGVVPIEEPEPQYLVKGVLVGNKPMAVFEDDKGNQRLVPLGGSVDGDTKVVGIERGKVTISRRGKEKTLVIQEEARND